MKTLDIIDLYKKGYSVQYIINEYYKNISKYNKENQYVSGSWYIPKKKYTKDYATKIVQSQIFEYLKEK